MRPSVAAAVVAGLWVLCTVGAAVPRRCLLSHYRSLEPRTLAAAKALRDRYLSDRSAGPDGFPHTAQRLGALARGLIRTRYLQEVSLLVPQEEEALSWEPRNCFFHPRRDPPRPSVRPGTGGGGGTAGSPPLLTPARPRSIADAQAVLSRLHRPELLPGAGPILELLAAAGRDVAACVSDRRAPPPPDPRPRRLLCVLRPTASPALCESVPLSGKTRPDPGRVLRVSTKPGLGLRLGSHKQMQREWGTQSFAFPIAGPARLLQEDPRGPVEASQAAETCECSRRHRFSRQGGPGEVNEAGTEQGWKPRDWRGLLWREEPGSAPLRSLPGSRTRLGAAKPAWSSTSWQAEHSGSCL
ncbi:hypothetical protein P7K49_034320 [Saguinus oedipus]|uniref:Uncharacterized protein n=1 Tax=Saguinus oedipus TaxID=9490 RepID=A0ABQ9TUE5_SAGOE|nr:hypothetical protein P7K49_034320 [Saguinus oedipus]